jgi:hypothetical protein
MESNTRLKSGATKVLAVLLWLATLGLGLTAIYASRDLIALIMVGMGGGFRDAELFAPWMVLILGVVYLVFVVVTTEYHRKAAGTPGSWRLFGWSLGVEAGILLLYYLL